MIIFIMGCPCIHFCSFEYKINNNLSYYWMLKLFMNCHSIKIENSKTEFHIYIYIIRNEIEAGDLCGLSHKAMLIKLTHSIGCVNKCIECVSLHRSCINGWPKMQCRMHSISSWYFQCTPRTENRVRWSEAEHGDPRMNANNSIFIILNFNPPSLWKLFRENLTLMGSVNQTAYVYQSGAESSIRFVFSELHSTSHPEPNCDDSTEISMPRCCR